MSTLASSPLAVHVDDKPNTIEHQELSALPDIKSHDISPTLTSRYANLSLRATLSMFPMATTYALMAAFNAANDGYCYSIPGNVIAMPGFIAKFGKDYDGKTQLDAKDVAAWGAIYTAGYIAILFIGSPLNDLLGRKVCMFLVQLFMVLSTVISLVANTAGVWGAAKVFQGLSVGLAQATVQSYVSEIAPTRARGFLLAVYQLFFAFGQLTAAIATYVVNSLPPDKWKHAIYSEFVLAGIALLLWIPLPESPRWCLAHGKEARAKAVMLRVNRGCPDYDVEGELAVIAQEIADGKAVMEAASRFSYGALFRGPNLRRLLISFGPFAWQQWSGVPVIFGYSSYFFAIAGLKNPFIGTLAVFIILLVGVVVSMFSIELVGRRPGLLFGGAGLTSMLLIVGGLGTIANPSQGVGSAVIAFSCIWVFIYALTLAPIGYAMLAETSTVVLRAKTTSIAAGMTGCLNLVVNYCTPLMLSPTGANWGVKGTAFFYAGTCFIGLVLVFCFVPETKGRSFSELDELFENRVPARKFKQTKTTAQLEMERV